MRIGTFLSIKEKPPSLHLNSEKVSQDFEVYLEFMDSCQW